MKNDAIALCLITEGWSFLPGLKDGRLLLSRHGRAAHGWDIEGARLCSERF